MNKELWIEAAKKAGYKTPQEIADEEETRRVHQAELENAKKEIKEFWEGEEGQAAKLLLHHSKQRIVLKIYDGEEECEFGISLAYYSPAQYHDESYIDSEGYRSVNTVNGKITNSSMLPIEDIVTLIADKQKMNPIEVLPWLKQRLNEIAERVKTES